MENKTQDASVQASDTAASSHNQWEGVTVPERKGPQPIGEVLSRLKLPYPRDFDVAKAESAELQREHLERRKAFRKQLPERYARCEIRNWRDSTPYQTKVKQAVTDWANATQRTGLVLFGPVGTGKDHLAVAAIDWRVQAGSETAMYINGRDFVGEVRDRIGDDSPEAALISRYRNPDILLISDPLPPIGDLTQHQADMLYRVVESRYAAGKITCCTLNVADDDEADRRLGVATWDRLCDGAWKIHCRWSSHRKPLVDLRP